MRSSTGWAVAACVAAGVLTAGMSAMAAEPPLPRYALTVALDPGESRLEGSMLATLLPEMGDRVTFVLHRGLSPRTGTPGATLARVGERDHLEIWEISLPGPAREFSLAWQGIIEHPLEQVGEEYARGQKETPGTIRGDGVFLSDATGWYPVIEGLRHVFLLDVTAPAGWEIVSQGRRTRHELDGGVARIRWESDEPQAEVWLVGGPLTEYARTVGDRQAMVFLRQPDPALAGKYLDATFQYIDLYSRLVGPYPYAKFALVENFWETGYGMPSFTLLGSQVIRLPFILTTSYPHEILHNWWGNSVGIDYASGNWGEGLTAYLSDHLMKEQRGEGAEPRLTTLQKYADYVRGGRDLPLAEFRSRHGSVSEAVGYGKGSMLFHMLRLELGDPAFVEGLRDFYRTWKFRAASFDDLRASFERASGRALGAFFDTWVKRSGAPVLALGRVTAEPLDGGRWRLVGSLRQGQQEDPYPITVPVAVTMEGVRDAFLARVRMDGREAGLSLDLPGRPVRVDVDPEYDLFRRLDPGEIPPAISRAFGAGKAVIVLPVGAPEPMAAAWRSFAETLRGIGPGSTQVVTDAEMDAPPPGESVWLLGWENRLLPAVTASLARLGGEVRPAGVSMGGTDVARVGHVVVATGSHPTDAGETLLWIAADTPAALPGLGRKLPHYHKYSFLGFEGDEPANVLKGRWEVTDSPLTLFLGAGRPARGSLPARKALAELPAVFDAARMSATVTGLASTEGAGRVFGSSPATGTARAATYIAREMAAAGLAPGADGGGWFQEFDATAGEPPRKGALRNVIGLLPGSDPALASERIVVGAHFDALVPPGADDNASGVAVMLELARHLAGTLKPLRTIVFAAFDGEEWGRLGSRRYVDSPPGVLPGPVMAMVNLDTVGRLGKRLIAIGAPSAREWVHILRGAGFVTGVEIDTPSADLDAGDHLSFREKGTPAIQLFTGPHADYHRPTDTPERVDAGGLARVAAVASEVVGYLAGRKEPLTPAGAVPAQAAGGGDGQARKVSIGTVPDFAWDGTGMRISGAVAGSPAEKAGLRDGDVIVSLDGREVGSLREFSTVLKTLSAGATVKLRWLRGETAMEADLTVEAR